MLEQPTWPPAPTVPNPNDVHDEFLTSLLSKPRTRLPFIPRSLVFALYRETGLGYQRCATIVSDYCKRYGIFTGMPQTCLWVYILFMLACMAGRAWWSFVIMHLQYLHDVAITQAARDALQHQIDGQTQSSIRFSVGFIVIVLLSWIPLGRFAFRQDAEARAKIALVNSGEPRANSE